MHNSSLPRAPDGRAPHWTRQAPAEPRGQKHPLLVLLCAAGRPGHLPAEPLVLLGGAGARRAAGKQGVACLAHAASAASAVFSAWSAAEGSCSRRALWRAPPHSAYLPSSPRRTSTCACASCWPRARAPTPPSWPSATTSASGSSSSPFAGERAEEGGECMFLCLPSRLVLCRGSTAGRGLPGCCSAPQLKSRERTLTCLSAARHHMARHGRMEWTVCDGALLARCVRAVQPHAPPAGFSPELLLQQPARDGAPRAGRAQGARALHLCAGAHVSRVWVCADAASTRPGQLEERRRPATTVVPSGMACRPHPRSQLALMGKLAVCPRA